MSMQYILIGLGLGMVGASTALILQALENKEYGRAGINLVLLVAGAIIAAAAIASE